METTSVNEAIDYEQVAQRKTRIAQLENELPACQAAASEDPGDHGGCSQGHRAVDRHPGGQVRETEFVKLAGLESALKQKIDRPG